MNPAQEAALCLELFIELEQWALTFCQACKLAVHHMTRADRFHEKMCLVPRSPCRIMYLHNKVQLLLRCRVTSKLGIIKHEQAGVLQAYIEPADHCKSDHELPAQQASGCSYQS